MLIMIFFILGEYQNVIDEYYHELSKYSMKTLFIKYMN
jgi:hypothetical protein